MTALPPALPGDLVHLDGGGAGAIALYGRGPEAGDGPPVLLVHSVNAAASAYEMRPLYERLARSRRVYALDLPGFGHSDRSERRYDPRLMTDAIHQVVTWMRRRHGDARVDAAALSLSTEFLARAATETPDAFRTLALISPTGLDRRGPYLAPPGTTRGKGWVRKVVACSLWDDLLFDNLTRPAVVRYFLERTWGAKDIDEGLWDYAVRTAAQPGAKHAPLWFLSGHLFSADIGRIYGALELPVWMTHGVRGDFTDYRGAAELTSLEGWRFRVFETGAMPHFEEPDAFAEEYEAFLDAQASERIR